MGNQRFRVDPKKTTDCKKSDDSPLETEKQCLDGLPVGIAAPEITIPHKMGDCKIFLHSGGVSVQPSALLASLVNSGAPAVRSLRELARFASIRWFSGQHNSLYSLDFFEKCNRRAFWSGRDVEVEGRLLTDECLPAWTLVSGNSMIVAKVKNRALFLL